MILKLRDDSEHGHPHDVLLTRLHTAELCGREAEDVTGHVAACPRCAERLEALAEERDAFAATHPVAAMLAKLPETRSPGTSRRSWAGLLFGGVTAMAAAAGLLLAVVSGDRHPDAVRLKSAAAPVAIGVIAVRDGEPRPTDPAALRPADRIQFTLTATADRYVAVVGLDDNGVVTVYHPHPNTLAGSPKPWPGGAERPLPDSFVLDAVSMRERVFALSCPRPVDVQALRTAIVGASLSLANVVLPDDALVEPTLSQCSQTSILLRKDGGR